MSRSKLSTEDFELSDEQKEAWQELLEQNLPPKITRTKIAESIAKAEGKSIASWKTLMTGFFRGDARPLKYVLTEEGRLGIVAKAFSKSKEQIKEWLQIARAGHPVGDHPLEIRLVGFEDYGSLPILEAYYPPCIKRGQDSLPPNNPENEPPRLSGHAGGVVELDDIVARLVPRQPPVELAIVIKSEPGLGKSVLLKAVAARMGELEHQTFHWPTHTTVPVGAVVLCDDIDTLGKGERQRLYRLVKDRTCTLVATTSVDDPLGDLPKYHSVYTLREGHLRWSLDFLEHIQKVARQFWGLDLSFEVLRSELEDDPWLCKLAGRLDLLGLLAREMSDKEGSLVPIETLPERIVEIFVERLGRLGYASEALLLDECGPEALSIAATELCLSSDFRLSRRNLAQAFVKAADGVVGQNHNLQEAWAKVGIGGMLSLADSLNEVGMFRRCGKSLLPTIPFVMIAFLGHALHKELHDNTRYQGANKPLLQEILLKPRLHDALIIAAQKEGELSPILKAIFEQPPAVLAQSVSALTLLLGRGLPAFNGELLENAFLLCLSWWARWPARERKMTITLGPFTNTGPEKVQEAWFGGAPPLLHLAFASLKYQSQLSVIEVESIKSSESIPPSLLDYLLLMGYEEAQMERVVDALAVGALFQTDAILEPKLWARFPLRSMDASLLPGGLHREDYDLWWRRCAVPRLMEEEQGEDMIAGVTEGFSILSGMSQNYRGSEIWRKALQTKILASHPQAPASFAKAIKFTLARGGEVNQKVLQRLWEDIPGAKLRRRLREAVVKALTKVEPELTWNRNDFATWIFCSVLGSKECQQLWELWSSQKMDVVPWKPLLEGGVDRFQLLSWALETLPQNWQRTLGGPTQQGMSGGIVLMNVDRPHEDACQAQVLQALALSNDVQIVVEIIRSGLQPWAEKAFHQFLKLDQEETRRARLELAPLYHQWKVRQALLGDLLPEPDEAELWEKIANSSVSLAESIARWAQYAWSAPENPWEGAHLTLKEAETLLMNPEQGWPLFLEMVAKQERESTESDALRAHFETLRKALPKEIGDALCDLSQLFYMAVEQGIERPEMLVRFILCSPHYRPYILGGRNYAPLWAVALDLLGEQFVVDCLVEGRYDHLKQSASQIRLHSFLLVGNSEFVWSLIGHPDLGMDAASVLGRTATHESLPMLIEGLEDLPFTALEDPEKAHSATLFLFLAYLRLGPDKAVKWLYEKFAIGGASLPLRRDWLSKVLQHTPAGELRSRLLGQHFSHGVSDCD